jgi:hypothetical protein
MLRAVALSIALCLGVASSAGAEDAGWAPPGEDRRHRPAVTVTPVPIAEETPIAAPVAPTAAPSPQAEPSAEPTPPEPPSAEPTPEPDRQGDLVQPIGMSVVGWVQAWPSYNHHLHLALSVPVVQAPWQMIIDAVPTLGTGSLAVSHAFLAGPVVIIPGLGLRYYGVNGTNTDGFLYGPQGRLGLSLPILSWLAVTGRISYSPWLQLMNKPGSGSFVELNGSLVAHVGRLSYIAGYTAMIVDPTGAGLWPAKGTFLGGPIGGVAFSF